MPLIDFRQREIPNNGINPEYPLVINSSNPLASQLVVASFPQHILQGNAINLVNGEIAAQQSALITYGVRRYGAAILWPTSAGSSTYFPQRVPALTNYTLMAFVGDIGTSGITQAILDNDTTVSPGRAFQFRLTTTNNVQFIPFDTTETNYSVSSAAAVPLTGGFWACATVSGLDFAVWLNGVKATGTMTNTAQPLTSPMWVGENKASSNPFTGQLYHWMVFSGALTDAEILSIQANPYQLVSPAANNLMLSITAGSPANNLTGSSDQSQTASGSASVSVPLVGASVQTQSGSAVISTGVAISGSATATQQANGSLSVSIPLSGASIQQAATTGTVSISVSLAGNAIQQAYASGTLTNTAAGAVNLSGTSSQSQSANGLLSLGNNLSGSSIAVSNASGSLTVLVPLSGVSVQAQQATGSLIVTATGVNLSGEAVQQALATGSLTMRINLSGESVQQAISSAYLSASGGMVSNPRWTINASGRNWTINAAGRNWTI